MARPPYDDPSDDEVDAAEPSEPPASIPTSALGKVVFGVSVSDAGRTMSVGGSDQRSLRFVGNTRLPEFEEVRQQAVSLVGYAIQQDLLRANSWEHLDVRAFSGSDGAPLGKRYFYVSGSPEWVAERFHIGEEHYGYPNRLLNIESDAFRFRCNKYEFRLYYDHIDNKPTDDELARSAEERLRILEAFAIKTQGMGVAEFGRQLFPELAHASGKAAEARLPTDAPDEKRREVPPPKWSDREPSDTPASFVRKHYGAWRDGVWDRGDLTKPALRKADLQLYNALAHWERRHPEEALHLPTLKEENDRWVERVMQGKEKPGSPLEMERFAVAARRRGRTLGGKSS